MGRASGSKTASKSLGMQVIVNVCGLAWWNPVSNPICLFQKEGWRVSAENQRHNWLSGKCPLNLSLSLSMCAWICRIFGSLKLLFSGFLLCSTTTEPFDTDKMALEFVNQFPQQAFTVGQELVFSFMEKKVLSVIVRELEGTLSLSFLALVHSLIVV